MLAHEFYVNVHPQEKASKHQPAEEPRDSGSGIQQWEALSDSTACSVLKRKLPMIRKAV